MPTRREIIMQLGAAAILPQAGVAADDYSLGAWTGDDFAPMHAIRDGLWSRPIPPPERRVDVAIVGAGLAGLAVASLLDDVDLLILERETQPGGNAKSGQWQGVDYALGSAFLVDLSERYGAFYEKLGLSPRPLAEPVDRVVTAASGDLLGDALKRPFEDLRRLVARLSKSADFPKIPIQKASAFALGLDRLSFLEFVQREHIDPALFGWLDAFCLSSLGAPANGVSAYAGVNFISEINGPIYAFPGGNAVVARAMAERVNNSGAGRIETGAAVFAIEPAEDGRARVAWFDAREPGATRCVSARWVVAATPYFFTSRILRGLPLDMAATMRSLSQGSYLVANCCLRGQAQAAAYDQWALDEPAFTDVIDAQAAVPAALRSQTHGVLTAYAPFENPAQGRALLREGERARLAAPIVSALRRYFAQTFAEARLEEVRLTRWGHQHTICRPGLVSQIRALPKRIGNVLLAHSDGQALPAAESAIAEALRVAAIIRS